MKRAVTIVIAFAVLALLVWLGVRNRQTAPAPVQESAQTTTTTTEDAAAPAPSAPAPSAPTPTPTPAPASATETPPPARRVITLVELNVSGEYGTAFFIPEGSKTRVILQLTGAPRENAQPAHIHAGSCANLGAVQYTLAAAVNGYSETILSLSLSSLLSKRPLAINVHQSTSEAGRYISCGNL